MARLAGETETLLSIQESVLSCADFSALERDVLAPAADYLGAATSCFIQFWVNPTGEIRFGRTAAHNVPERAHQGYLTHHFRGDPAINAASRNFGSMPYVFCTSEVSDYSELTNSPFYNDFFRPNCIHHVMVMTQRPQSRDGDMLIFGFHRPRSDRPFSDTEKHRLKRLASALGCSARTLCLQDDFAMSERAIAEYGAAYPAHGLVFLDDHMRVLYGNRTGLAHLALQDVGGRVRLEALTRACQRALRTSDTADAVSVDISRSGGIVASVRARSDHEGRLVFVVHTNRRNDEAVFETRCREYQLSPREVDITRALAAGLSNTEIAGRLFISVRTVENHLRSIYAKAGVNRRTQLLSRLNDFE